MRVRRLLTKPAFYLSRLLSHAGRQPMPPLVFFTHAKVQFEILHDVAVVVVRGAPSCHQPTTHVVCVANFDLGRP